MKYDVKNSKNEEVFLSVVIPVHNGEKVLRKTVKGICKQTYENFEIILVENNSKDSSYELCLSLEKEDSRIRALQSNEKGTSLARKKGVENAKGKYIIFSDQDDEFYDKNSISAMVNSIVEDGSQICQFNFYKKRRFYIKKTSFVNKACVFSQKEVFEKHIGGIFGTQSDSVLNQTVWSKIYDAEMLKNAVKNINTPLYFAEDLYLNLWAFFDDKTKIISARPFGAYVWKVGVGFSSSKKSSTSLFDDYETVKVDALKLMKKHNINSEYEWNNNIESLYSFKVYICGLINGKVNRDEVIEIIEKINSYKYIKQAKEGIITDLTHSKWDELMFMVSDYKSDEYYDWCLQRLPKKSFRSSLRSLISRFI